MKVLGFDPGLAKVGWAVGEFTTLDKDAGLSVFSIIDLGTWKTEPTELGVHADHVHRALDIGMRADQLMEIHQPGLVFAEEQGRMPSARAYAVLRVASAISLAAVLREISYAEDTAQNIKKVLTGDRGADKDIVEDDVLRYVTPDALARFQKAHPRMKKSTKRGIRDHAFDAGGAMVAGLVKSGRLAHTPNSVRLRKARAS